MSDKGQLVYGQLGGRSRVHTLDDGIHVSDEAGIDRVHIGRLSESVNGLGQIVGEYGLRVVSSDGSTVIIDGTSDMYRIVATGTLNIAAGPNGNAANLVHVIATVDVATGFTYLPQVLGWVQSGSQSLLGHLTFGDDGLLQRYLEVQTQVFGGNQTRVLFDWGARVNDTAIALTARYAILEQVAF